MAGGQSNETDRDVLAVLLHPATVAVMDVFREQDQNRGSDDLTFIQEAELSLSRYTSKAWARSVVSEAILLGFSLDRERAIPMGFRRVGTRRTSADERALMALLSAGRAGEDAEALRQASSDLGIPHDALTSSAAANLAARIEEAGLPWPPYRGERTSARPSSVPLPVASPDDAAFQFKK